MKSSKNNNTTPTMQTGSNCGDLLGIGLVHGVLPGSWNLTGGRGVPRGYPTPKLLVFRVTLRVPLETVLLPKYPSIRYTDSSLTTV